MKKNIALTQPKPRITKPSQCAALDRYLRASLLIIELAFTIAYLNQQKGTANQEWFKPIALLIFTLLDVGIQTKGFYQTKEPLNILRVYGTEILLNHALFLMNAWLGETEEKQYQTIGLNVQRLYIAFALNPTGQFLNLYFKSKKPHGCHTKIRKMSNENKVKTTARQTIAACSAVLMGSGPLIYDSTPWSNKNIDMIPYRIALNSGYFSSVIASETQSFNDVISRKFAINMFVTMIMSGWAVLPYNFETGFLMVLIGEVSCTLCSIKWKPPGNKPPLNVRQHNKMNTESNTVIKIRL